MIRSRLWLLALVSSCAHSPHCPAPYQPDPERSRRILALLADDPEGRALVDRPSSKVGICFAPAGPGVTTDELLLLDANATDRALAARVAHLLLHRRNGARLTSGEPDKPDEAEANALEKRIAARLAAKSPPP
jgi:hypothetical protein